jgi:hypothetical protein
MNKSRSSAGKHKHGKKNHMVQKQQQQQQYQPVVKEEEDEPQILPLENEWCFWYDKYPGPNLSPADYKAALYKIGSFGTVSEFWQWFNNLKTPDRLGPKQSLHLMKKDVYVSFILIWI